mmetsp:Transcript_18751/g.26445  ORF Transcript_18751/g.26445 Transcript_18751/m.26445 type:complete len:315 (+) Transcript_18751:2-946(+)
MTMAFSVSSPTDATRQRWRSNNNIVPLLSPRIMTTMIHSTSKENSSKINLETTQTRTQLDKKQQLMELLEQVPANQKSSTELTSKILKIVQEIEMYNNNKDDADSSSSSVIADKDVLSSLAGNWQLLWTAQDKNSQEWKVLQPWKTWINPLENQSYSNNPTGSRSSDEEGGGGRSNPILPQNVQDNLEKMGIIVPQPNTSGVRSSQGIDLKKKRVRNVVSFEIHSLTTRGNNNTNRNTKKATLVVDVGFQPNSTDLRRIDVKFESCRVTIQDSPIDFTIPLGMIGPTGWLRTVYIDDTIRITRGHKGSVFILSR